MSHFLTLSKCENPRLDLIMLSHIRDDKMYRKLSAVVLTKQQKENISQLIAAFEEALFPMTETRIMRSSLTSLKQSTGEKVEDFAMRIEETSAKAYSKCELREEAALSVLLSGINSGQIQQKLLEADVKSFDEATKMAIKLERISETISDREKRIEPGEIDFNVLRLENGSNNPANNFQQPETHNHGKICQTCGENDHVTENCKYGTVNVNPLSNIICYNCSRRGHRASQCRSRSQYGYNNQQQNGYGLEKMDPQRPLPTELMPCAYTSKCMMPNLNKYDALKWMIAAPFCVMPHF